VKMSDKAVLDALESAPDITGFAPAIDETLPYNDLAWLYSRYQRWFIEHFHQLPSRSWKSFAEELEARGYQVRLVGRQWRVYA